MSFHPSYAQRPSPVGASIIPTAIPSHELEQRIRAVEISITSFSRQLFEFHQEIPRLGRHVQSLEERVTRTETTDQRRPGYTNQQRLDDLENKVARIIQELMRQISRLEERVGRTEAPSAELVDALLNRRLTSAEADLNAYLGSFAQCQQAVINRSESLLRHELSVLQAGHTNTNQQLATLQASHDNVNQRLAAFQGSNSIDQRLTTLEASTQASLETLENKIGDCRNYSSQIIQSFNQIVGPLSQRLTNLEARLQTSSSGQHTREETTRRNQVQGELRALREEFSSWLNDLQARQNRTDNWMDDLRHQINRINNLTSGLQDQQNRTDLCLQALQDRQNYTDGCLQALQGHQLDIDGWLQALQDRQNRTDGWLQALQDRQDFIVLRLDAFDRQMETLQNHQNELRTRRTRR